MLNKTPSRIMVSIGNKNAIAADKVIAIVSAESAPIKRLKDLAKKDKRLIDATGGKKTNTVIVTTSNHVILSSAQPETIAQRFSK